MNNKKEMLKNRNFKPVPSEEHKFHVPVIQRMQLENGLNILLVERHNLPLIRVNLMINCGSKADPEGKKGLSNLFAMTVDEGAGKYNALELSSEFDLLGSDFDIHCTNDCIYFLSRSLKENLERTIELFSFVIQAPHLNDPDFQKEKSKVITRIMQTRDDPDEIASNAFEYLVHNRENPYAFPVIGKDKDVKNIDINDIKAFYNQYISPSDSYLMVVGDITARETEDLAKKYFLGWRGNHTDNNPSFKLTGSPEPQVYFIDKPGSLQTEIRIGHITEKRNNQNYFPRMLLNLVLGGQFSSRINLNLRENKGYTYGAFSNFNYFQNSGYFFVSTSVGMENTFNAVIEIRKEIEGIMSGVTEEELLFAKTSLIRKFPSNFETNGQIASTLSRMVLYKLPENHFDNYMQVVHNIDIDQVNKAALDYIKPDKLITLLVGNKEDIISQFAGKSSLTELDFHGDYLV